MTRSVGQNLHVQSDNHSVIKKIRHSILTKTVKQKVKEKLIMEPFNTLYSCLLRQKINNPLFFL